MPNWTNNTITVQNPDVIKRFINADGEFDFNLLIPMPESLNIESGSRTDEAIAIYVTNQLTIPVEQTNLSQLISNIFNKDWAKEICERLTKKQDTDINQLYEMGKQYIFNKEHYGCYTWYEWCNRNWGTKWNACESYVEKDDMTVVFDTAWCLPEPIFQKMCEIFPDEPISFHCVYEEGFYYDGENRNGEFTIVDEGTIYEDDEEEEIDA